MAKNSFVAGVTFKVSLFDYHSDLNHKGCIVRDERRDEIDKKDI